MAVCVGKEFWCLLRERALHVVSISNLADPPVPGVHPLPESRNKRFNIKSLALGDDVLEQPVQQLAAVLDVLVGVGHHTADRGEHLIEQGKDRFSRHLNKTSCNLGRWDC